MLSWFLNPWMLLGGLAVASPILIHLLNYFAIDKLIRQHRLRQ